MDLLGKGMDPEFWKEVREKECFENYRDELHFLWKKHCENIPIYSLKYSDFRLFVANGNRSIYESAYFTRRQALNCSALLALIYPEEEKYIVRLMDEIYAICDEYTWCLPAHQPNRDINDNCHIDLFAAETGFTLSEIYTLLGNRLEPLIRDRIRVEIDRRIIIPFTTFKGDYGGWENKNTNWTAVCMGSVAGAVMHMHPETVESLLPRFTSSIDNYLTGFNDDGMCMEGCGYWHYGFGFFTVYADLIKRFTGGRVDYFKLPKVRTVATFIQKMFLSGKACVSFADGNRELTYHLGLVHYLKKLYPDDVVVYSPSYSYNYDGCGRFCLHLRSALWFDEDIYNHPADDNIAAEYYAPQSEWFVKRTANYGFAAKGGCNAEMHNHNDVGTFIFAKNGHQIIADLGRGTYTRQYFAADTRYGILECSSRGHNVPIIGGTYQYFSKDAKAVGTKYENGIFSFDFADAYKADGLRSIRRSFAFTDDGVTMTDSFVYNGGGVISERLVTLFEPELLDGCIKIDEATVTFDKDICDVEITVEPHGGKNCYLINFNLKPDIRAFEIAIK